MSTNNTSPTFAGPNGRASIDFGQLAFAYAMALQQDGRILIAGTASTKGIALARLTTQGGLDLTFDTDGRVESGNRFDQVFATTVMSDGKIVIAGQRDSDFLIARFNANGSMDSTFGQNGAQIVDFTASELATDLIALPDGKLLIAGYGSVTQGLHSNPFQLARLNADGSLDTTFDGDGKVSTEFAGWGQLNEIAAQADKKIIASGVSNGDLVLLRYTQIGSLDPTFDGDGLIKISLGEEVYRTSIAVQGDGKLVVAASLGRQVAVLRYFQDGSLDQSFGNSGRVMIGAGYIDAKISIQADGKIIVGGNESQGSNWHATVTRLNRDGSSDNSFGLSGTLPVNILPRGVGQLTAIEQQPDGKLLIAGHGYSSETVDRRFIVLRLNENGAVDSTFGPATNTLSVQAGYTEDSLPNVLAPTVHIFDSELAAAGHYAGASLSLSRQGAPNPQDIFSAKHQGSLSPLIEGSDFAIDGITIGKVTNNSSGSLVLRFNSQATQLRVDATLQQIAYSNASDAPPASVSLDWNFSDGNAGGQGAGGPLSATGTTFVTIWGSNDSPRAFAAVPQLIGYTGTKFEYTFPNLTFSDPDLDKLSLRLTKEDGTGLPTWLTFDAETGKLVASPGLLETGNLRLTLTAKDPSGASAMQPVVISTIAHQPITGTNLADVLVGTLSDDIIAAQDGNDTLEGWGGNDSLAGGRGIDIAVYRLNASISRSADGWRVTSAVEGTDQLTDVERVKFGPSFYALDLEGNAGTVVKTLGAVFSKAMSTDPVFIGIGLHYLDAGMSFESLMQLAIDARLGPGASHAAIVDLLYSNVVGVQPSPEERAYFVNLLDSQTATVPGLGVMAAETNLNLVNVNLVGLVDTGVGYIPFDQG